MTLHVDGDAVRSARSFLFVPGDRPERFGKAVDTGADVVVLDLEDAVAPQDKETARTHVEAWLTAGRRAMVRINAADTAWHDDDLALVREHRAPVMVAKAERPDQLGRVADAVRGAPLVPLIETARGVASLDALCAVPGVTRLAFGSIDLANQLGVDPQDRNALLLHRTMLVLASAAAGLAAPIDGVTTVFDETETLTADHRHAKGLGMSAKLCIHPRQVAAVHAASEPSDDELAWARAVLVANARSGGSAAAVDGQMVDAPVLARARSMVAAAQRS